MPAKQDHRYFIDTNKYNCPFCETAAVSYRVVETEDFDWSNDRVVRCVRVQCQQPDCRKISLHMTDYDIGHYGGDSRPMKIPYIEVTNKETGKKEEVRWDKVNEMDELFFYHHPNSTFTIDDRIPKKIRDALDQANTAHKMGLSIGASAALRKAIFEILSAPEFNIPKKETSATEDGEFKYFTYQERLGVLKEKIEELYPSVDIGLVDDIVKIYSLSSQPLHERLVDEGEWEDFTSAQFIFLLEVVHTLLVQIYIIPSENQARKGKLVELAKKVRGLVA